MAKSEKEQEIDQRIAAADPEDSKGDHPTVEVEFIQGYFPAEGEAKIVKGSRRRLQIEDARYLVESKIAVLTDQFEGR